MPQPVRLASSNVAGAAPPQTSRSTNGAAGAGTSASNLRRAILLHLRQAGPSAPDMIAAAMGGSIPPILWDGAGDAIVLDPVGVLSLNLPDVATPQSEAKPAPADLSKGTPPAALPAITLPESMEAKVK